MAVSRTPRRITTAEYHAMIEAGELDDRPRAELLAGEIRDAAPIGSPHAACVWNLQRLFMGRLAGRLIVRVQNPIELPPLSEPEPDIALAAWRDDGYASAHPRPEDVLLVVEVAHTTYDTDRGLKLPLYAAAGIAEVWIVHLEAETIEVYRDPAGGHYRRLERRGRGELVTPRLLPDCALEVSEILPRAAV